MDRVAHRVEKDVGGLEVAVDDRRVGVVEEGEALGGAGGDLHPPHPRHGAVETCTQHVSFGSASCSSRYSQQLLLNANDFG